jgi:manganese transport protein
MNFKKLLSYVLPGIFLFGYCVGTGSVTAMAKAGADYGMSLLWTLLISCYITYFLIDLYGRFTLVTGETALAAFRKFIHPAAGLFFVIALTVNISGSIIGVMGIIADVCAEWFKVLFERGIHPTFFALFFIGVVYALFWNGKTRVFQKVLTIIVAIMAICFTINFFITMPSLSSIARGFVPNVPNTGDEKDAFLVIASMVGTTVFSGLFILRGSLVKEAGWTLADLKIQRNDAIVAASMMFVVSGAIMASAAGTLYLADIKLTNVSEMITLLEPTAGTIGVAIFALGIVAAGVSSQFPNVLLLPWLLDDYHGLKPNMRKTNYRVYVFLLSCLGLIVPVFNTKPIAVMMASQAFGALVLPATVGCLIFVGNQKSIMKEYVFSVTINIQLTAIMAFALFMSYLSYSGLFLVLSSF